MARPGPATTLATGAILAAALAVRLREVRTHRDSPLHFDPQDYDRHARSLVTQRRYPRSVHPYGGPTAFRPPGYPFFLAAVYRVAAPDLAPPPPGPFPAMFAYTPARRELDAARAAQAVLGTGAVALTGHVARRVAGPGAGVAALALAAAYPPWILVGATLFSEPLFVVLELGAIAAALEQRRAGRGVRGAVAAGALAGATSLTRTNGATLLAPLALLVRRPAPVLALAAAAAAVVAPWTLRNRRAFGAFVPVSSQSGYTLAGSLNATARADAARPGLWRPAHVDPAMAAVMAGSETELAQDRALGEMARDFARRHPGYVVSLVARNVLRMLHLDRPPIGAWLWEEETYLSPRAARVAVHAVHVLAVLAAAGARTPAARAVPRPLWLVPALFSSVVLVAPGNRFRAPIEPFLILLAALGVDDARRRVRRR